MPVVYLPDAHHVIRYVPWSRLRKDEDDHVIGVLGAAFRLRESEEYLSATWAEYFASARPEFIVAAAMAIRASNVTVTPRSGFAIGNVGKIKETCLANERKHKVRIIHEEEDDNKAHTALRQWPRDNDPLLELIAADVWNEVVLNRDVPDAR